MMFYWGRLCLYIFVSVLVACGSDGEGGGSDSANPKVKSFLSWEAVPEQYNPKIDRQEIDLSGVRKLEINIFGFDKDVRVRTSDRLAKDRALIEIYKVTHNTQNSSLVGQTSQTLIQDSLAINKQGNYSCSIEVSNGTITHLEGSCYVRMVVTLPTDREIEVYNLGFLVGPRYFAMSVEDFLYKVDRASFKEQKFSVIDQYLESHQQVKKRPRLLADHLSTILGEFAFDDDKFTVLRKLHTYVRRREDLRPLIDKHFARFHQDEALEICGLHRS
jgi:hypothetical protein